MAKHLIIAGMQRSGTTWLREVLDQHPEIYMVKPVRPELKFFLNAEENLGNYSFYRQYFEDLGDDFAGWLGEKCTSYSEFSELPRKIKHFFGDDHAVRILFMLRHPIKRAISNVHFSQTNGLEDRSLERALREQLKGPPRKLGDRKGVTSVDPKAYLERGLYWQQLEPYFSTFGKTNVKAVLSENTFGNLSVINEIFSWLGLKEMKEISGLSLKINKSENKVKIDDIPDDLKKELYDFYWHSCKDLSKNLNMDLSIWDMEKP